MTKFNWKRCANPPTVFENSRGMTSNINGRVYYGGGTSYFYGDEYAVFCYDPPQDKWTTLPPLPVKWFGLGQVDGKLVAVGGKEEQNKSAAATDKMYTYDDQLQMWKLSIPMPTARYSPGVLSLNTALIVAGGEIITKKTAFFGRTSYVNTLLDIIEIFKSDTLQWYQTNPLPRVCRKISLVAIGNTCYAIGGYDESYFHTNQALHASVDDLLGNAVPANQITQSGSSDTQSAWKTLPSTPTSEPISTVLAGKLLAIGQRSMDVTLDNFSDHDEIYVYVASTNSWAYCGNLALPVHGSSITVSALSSIEILIVTGNTTYRGIPMLF